MTPGSMVRVTPLFTKTLQFTTYGFPARVQVVSEEIMPHTIVDGVTVKVVDPEMLPVVAVIVVEPAVIVVTRPLDPAALLIVATDISDEPHVTCVVKSCVVLSE